MFVIGTAGIYPRPALDSCLHRERLEVIFPGLDHTFLDGLFVPRKGAEILRQSSVSRVFETSLCWSIGLYTEKFKIITFSTKYLQASLYSGIFVILCSVSYFLKCLKRFQQITIKTVNELPRIFGNCISREFLANFLKIPRKKLIFMLKQKQ